MNDAIVEALRTLVDSPFATVNVAFVPTAANVEPDDKGWLIDDLYRFRSQGFASIDIVDLSALPPVTVRRRLERAQVVVFGGGNTYHLREWVGRVGDDNYWRSLFAERIYVGISAGSMLSNPHLVLSSENTMWGDLGGPEDPWQIGLGFVDFYFRPHLDSMAFPTSQRTVLDQMTRKVAGITYAVDDESALQVADGVVKIVGSGEVLTNRTD